MMHYYSLGRYTENHLSEKLMISRETKKQKSTEGSIFRNRDGIDTVIERFTVIYTHI